MAKLVLMMCTRCHAARNDIPDTTDQRSDLMGLATVHFDKRPPYSGDYQEDTVYVTPHHRHCRELARTMHDGGHR